MIDLQLEHDEEIILTRSQITKGITALGAGELVLTNKNIIFYRKNLIGNSIKSIEKCPLESITMFNGEPRVMAKRNAHKNVVLAIYAGDKMLEYVFLNNYTRSEAIQWVNAIYNVLIGRDSKDQGDASSLLSKAKSIVSSGGGIIGEAGASIVGNFKNKLENTLSTDKNTILTIKCPSCGAPITGYKGENKRCNYCDTTVKIQ